MILYNWIKIIHVISASVMFGTGLGSAFYMLYVNFQKDIALTARVTKQVVLADWLFTGTSGVVQAVTGISMVLLKGYSIFTPWIIGSIAGYIIAGACWLPVVWLQIRCRDLAFIALQRDQPLPKLYHRYFIIWWMLGIPAFLALLGVFYLMSNKVPVSW